MQAREKTTPPQNTAAASCAALGAGAACAETDSPQANGQRVAVAPGAPTSRWWTAVAAGVIVLAGVAAYSNSFAGPFLYDDYGSIVDNPTIRQLWPIWQVLSPPANGETVSGRPLLNLSFAVNYWLGGLRVWGYHAVNLAIHIAAALLLFGILRRTFLLASLRPRFANAATWLALAISAVWLLHPLQTESVTYIVQRAESLMGLCYLLTLYCVIRGTTEREARDEGRGTRDERQKGTSCSPLAPRPSPLIPLWYVAAVLACLAGMACKEVMVTAPIAVLLYDVTFLSDSWRQAVTRRKWLYLGLAATWGLLIYLTHSTGLIAKQSELGSPDPWSYARSQPGVILHYLRLCFWPHPLCIEYARPVTRGFWQVVLPTLVVGALLAATAWGLWKRRAWGFLAAWFFLILAPSSSILPLHDLVYEHRMYLSLAAMVALVLACGYAAADKLLPRPPAAGFAGVLVRWAAPLTVLALMAAALASATRARNLVYGSALVILQDIIHVCPENAAAHNNLGNVLEKLGRIDEAIGHCREALRLKPHYAVAHNNLANALVRKGRPEEAIRHYREAVRLDPAFAAAHRNLGLTLFNSGMTDEAIAQFREAVRLKPDYASAHHRLGDALLRAGDIQGAIDQWNQTVQLTPEDAAPHHKLGVALSQLGKSEEAIEQCRTALRIRPNYAEAHNTLGVLLARTRRLDEAIAHYQQALQQEPDHAPAHNNLAAALADLGKTTAAIEHYGAALRLRPDYAEARQNLDRLLDKISSSDGAIPQYRQLLQQAPDSPRALNNLAWLLATREPAEGGNGPEAVQLAQRARELAGEENAECLDTLAAAYAAAGRFDDAILAAERALRLAESAGQTTLAQRIQSRLELYRAGRPYRSTANSAAPTAP